MTPDIKRILVPIDFSANSSRALDYAHGMAVEFGAAIHLVHVCEVPSMLTASIDAYALLYTDWRLRLGEEASVQLLAEAARILDVVVTTEVLFGNAAASIIDAAPANRADLIVMGTHGHGAMMHMVMGNVAERVVRGAPCPVLTVREPRPREVKNGVATKLAVAGAAVLAAFLAMPAAAFAQEQQPKQSTPGAETYRTYCVTCHGTSARGDGPLAASMQRKPANLTEIAKRNGGVFPGEMVFKTIDGRNPVRGHGGPDMPAWAEAFSKSRDTTDPDGVKSLIQSLVDYLESIQQRTGNNQQ